MATDETAANTVELGDEQFRDVYLRIKTDLLVVGDSILTDRHLDSSPSGSPQYEDDYPQNKIGGIIPSFPLSGWLRHGMEAVIQQRGGTACHPGEANGNFKLEDIYERDLDNGYHEKGSCVDDTENVDSSTGCVVFDLFGGFGGIPGKVMRRPIQFHPLRSQIDYSRGQAEGHYRRINRNITSRNEDDHRRPLRTAEYDAVANLDGSWHLSFREIKPEFIGLLAETAAFLDDHQTDFMHQLGGSRNFGAGIVDVDLINPLYDETDFKNVFDRNRSSVTDKMETKDNEWESEYLPVVTDALHDRIDATAD